MYLPLSYNFTRLVVFVNKKEAVPFGNSFFLASQFNIR